MQDKQNKIIGEVTRGLLKAKKVQVSRTLGILTLLASMLYLFLLFYVDIGGNANPVEIYIRVISSVLAMLVLSFFFEVYYKFHSHMGASGRDLKRVSIFLAVAGAIKVVISIYYLIICLINSNLIFLFYLGEILVWMNVALFALIYFKYIKR